MSEQAAIIEENPIEGREKKTVAQMMVDRLIERLGEGGVPPWVQPYNMTFAINRYTMKPYSGFNRIIIPLFGASEVMTFKQLINFNKEAKAAAEKKGETAPEYRVRKGSGQIPLCFFSKGSRAVSRPKFQEVFPGHPMTPGTYKQGKTTYIIAPNGKITKTSFVLRYFGVFDIKDLQDENGNSIPSLEEQGILTVTHQEPKEVFDRYVEREGIQVIEDNSGTPKYTPKTDIISLNYTGNEEHFWASSFHECSHSTGHSSRLARYFVTEMEKGTSGALGKEGRAKEELVAEIASGMICQEVGIDVNVVHGGISILENTAAYVKSWQRHIKENPGEFITICSMAEKAFAYVTDVDYNNTSETETSAEKTGEE